MPRATAHPIRDDVAAESESDYDTCPIHHCQLVSGWYATEPAQCPTCREESDKRFSLRNHFATVFGESKASLFEGEHALNDMERYARIFKSTDLADEIKKHIEFYGSK